MHGKVDGVMNSLMETCEKDDSYDEQRVARNTCDKKANSVKICTIVDFFSERLD